LSAKIDAAKPQASLSATDRHALNRTFFKNAKNPSYDRITDAIGKENVAGGVGKFATTVRDLIERHGHDTTAVKTHVIDRLDAIAAPLATSQVDEVKEKFHGSMDTFFKDSEAIAAASHTASASTDASTVSSLSHGDRETQEARVKEMFEELGKEFSQDKETQQFRMGVAYGSNPGARLEIVCKSQEELYLVDANENHKGKSFLVTR